MAGQRGAKVLIVDDDEDIGQLVKELLTDEGYVVSILKNTQTQAVQEAVAQQPDCILLDGGVGAGYGESWDSAALLAVDNSTVPVIMFTGHSEAAAEVQANESLRSQATSFSAVLMKPFDLSELLSVVEQATAQSRRSVST